MSETITHQPEESLFRGVSRRVDSIANHIKERNKDLFKRITDSPWTIAALSLAIGSSSAVGIGKASGALDLITSPNLVEEAPVKDQYKPAIILADSTGRPIRNVGDALDLNLHEAPLRLSPLTEEDQNLLGESLTDEELAELRKGRVTQTHNLDTGERKVTINSAGDPEKLGTRVDIVRGQAGRTMHLRSQNK